KLPHVGATLLMLKVSITGSAWARRRRPHRPRGYSPESPLFARGGELRSRGGPLVEHGSAEPHEPRRPAPRRGVHLAGILHPFLLRHEPAEVLGVQALARDRLDRRL